MLGNEVDHAGDLRRWQIMRHCLNNFQPRTGHKARDILATFLRHQWVGATVHDQRRHLDRLQPFHAAAIGDDRQQLPLHADGIITAIKGARGDIDKGVVRTLHIGKRDGLNRFSTQPYGFAPRRIRWTRCHEPLANVGAWSR